jgi:tRNA threonylcarbamoyladenosine biosynthesis protein TsaE
MTSTSRALDRTIALPDELATARLAVLLGTTLRAADCLLLQGTLGSGKSALARAIIQSRLGNGTEVPSPTFTLVQTYGDGPDEIWHADLYRLSGPDDLIEVGLADAIGRAICMVEWPDRLGNLAPPDALTVELTVTGDTSRLARLTGGAEWINRLGRSGLHD